VRFRGGVLSLHFFELGNEGEVMRANRMLKAMSVWGAAVAVVGSLATLAAQQAPVDPVKQLRDTKVCPSCFLAEASLTAADLKGANLIGANLFEANLYYTNLENADLTGAMLGKANLRKARLKGANLSGADLTGANLWMATDVNFEGATTTSATTCPDGTAGPCR
jgi:hypothetical protein